MLKNVGVPTLVAMLLAGSSAMLASSAIAQDKPQAGINEVRDAKAQTAVGQPVALGEPDMSAAKKKKKKTKETTKEPEKSK
jgi:hypothetical protein